MRLRKTASLIVLAVCMVVLVFPATAANDEWDCPNCGRKDNIRRFCGTCGTERSAGSSVPDSYDPEEIQTGSILQFGRYEQDGNPENGPEPIRWIVLDRRDAKVLLLSQYGLESRKFNDNWNYTGWNNSDLAGWLNSDFLSSSFTEEEQAYLVPVKLDNGLSRKNIGSRPGADSRSVFLLSETEIKEYLTNNDRLRCQPTRYLIQQEAYIAPDVNESDRCWWWLRTWERSGYMDDPWLKSGPRIVDHNGELQYYGANNPAVAVRPACWVDLARKSN